MPDARFFVEGEIKAGDVVALDSQDVRHALLVLRLRPGDKVSIVCANDVWEAELIAASGRAASARAIRPMEGVRGELPVPVTVLQAVVKGAKFDTVIEKCVELGASRIVPVVCERSYAGSGERKVDRWRRIARAAAQQSRRRMIPAVDHPIAWADGIAALRGAALLVAHPEAGAHSLAAALKRRDPTTALAIAVGPEGSLTSEELQIASAAGADLVSLGPTILRTETAAAATLAAIAALRGWW